MKKIFLFLLFILMSQFILYAYPVEKKYGQGMSQSTQMAPQKVLFDTDMGLDDWMALIYLLAHPQIQVKGISVVGTGESDLIHGVHHAGNITVGLGYPHIPIFAPSTNQAFYPYKPPHQFPQYILDLVKNGYGVPFLKTKQWEKATISSSQNFYKTYAHIIKMNKGITLIVTGPLTNVANLLKKDPSVIPYIKNIYIMGGSFYTKGNLSHIGSIFDKNHYAEWNIFCDPASLKYVLSVTQKTPISIYFASLDTTNKLPMTHDFYNKIVAAQKKYPKNRALTYIKDMLSTKDVQNGIGTWFDLWDPTAAILAVNCLEHKKCHLATPTIVHFNVNTSSNFVFSGILDPKLPVFSAYYFKNPDSKKIYAHFIHVLELWDAQPLNNLKK